MIKHCNTLRMSRLLLGLIWKTRCAQEACIHRLQTQSPATFNSTTCVQEVFPAKGWKSGRFTQVDGGVKAFTDNWRISLKSHHLDWAVNSCLNLIVVVPGVLLASSSSSSAWRGSSAQTRYFWGPPQAEAACQTVWGIWCSGSPGRVAGRADGVAPVSAPSSASVADALLAGQLFLLEIHN